MPAVLQQTRGGLNRKPPDLNIHRGPAWRMHAHAAAGACCPEPERI